MIDFRTYRPNSAPEVLVVVLHGRLDGETSGYLMECVQDQLNEDVRKIVLDCSELEFISSLGLGTLLRASLRVRKENGAVVLAEVKGLVSELLQFAQLGKLVNIYSDVTTAAEALQHAGC